VNVVITLVIIVFVAVWGAAVYSRLVRLRTQVKHAWAKKDRESYNKLAMGYNESLAAFPGNIVAGLAGFKPAKPFDSQ
jgi:hypothetical protein